MVDVNPLTPDIAVCGQLRPADMAELARLGYKAVICNRPDNEEPGQPTMEENARAAKAAGLAYMTLPVSGKPTAVQGEVFAGMVAKLPTPLVAHCKGGGRSAMLVKLAGLDA